MPRMTVLQGLPASGKSSYAFKLKDEHDARIVSTDDMRARIPPDKKGRDALAFGMAYAEATRLLVTGHDVIVDATNTTLDAINTWRGVAEMACAEFRVVRLPTPLCECIERNNRRQSAVPLAVMLRMASQLAAYDEAQP